MRSVTKNQLDAASSSTSSGNSKSRSATADAMIAAISSTSSQKRKPSKTPESVSGSQPNHSRIEPRNTTNATTPLVASNPAVTK